MTDTLEDVSALAQGSKIFSSNFAERLSSAAGLCLEELRWQDSLPSNSGRLTETLSWLDVVFYQSGDFQSRIWIRGLILITAVLCTCLISISGICATDKPSGFPWNWSSIVAKAIILSKSPIPSSFSETGSQHLPEDVYQIRALRLGQWALDSGHASYEWRLDTLCNAVSFKENTKVPKNFPSEDRYSSKSLPRVIGWWSVVVKAVIVTLGMATITLVAMQDLGQAITKNYRDGKILHFSSLPLICGRDCFLQPDFGTNILFLAVPLLITFAIVGWWDSFARFYRERQPWAGLSSPAPARFNLTLDYSNSYFTIWRALKNRHWLIVLLGVGSTINLFLPVLVAGLYHLEWHTVPMEPILLSRRHDWSLPSLNSTVSKPHEHMFRSALLNTMDSPGKDKWSFNGSTLLPLELLSQGDYLESSIKTGYWKAKTSFIRGEMSCSRLNRTEIVDHQGLRVHLPDGSVLDDGQESFILRPCEVPSGGDRRASSFGTSGDIAVCNRWSLKSVLLPSSNEALPVWFIGVVYGNSKTNHIKDPSFDPDQREALALMCTPSIIVGEGNVTLISGERDTQWLEDAYVYDFQTETQTQLQPGDSWAFSRMLNDSIHHGRDVTDDLILPEASVVTPWFIGDVMGFLTYRDKIFQDPTLDFATGLGTAVSRVYSRVLYSLVEETTWITKQSSVHVEVTPIVWDQRIITSRPTLYILLAVGAFHLVSVIILGIPRKRYTFPLSPESLENALFFLYRSSILKHLEKIPHPEKMTIHELHRAVERLGLKYSFGQYNTGSLRFGVDVPEAFESRDTEQQASEDEPGDEGPGNITEDTPLMNDI